jgi:hypothetical protein
MNSKYFGPVTQCISMLCSWEAEPTTCSDLHEMKRYWWQNYAWHLEVVSSAT